MNIALWIAQGLLAAMFGMAGIMKTTQPKEKLGEQMPWVLDLPQWVRFIGLVELLGAIGVVVPWATGILPILTPIAAASLALVMLLAIIYHIRAKDDTKSYAPSVFLLLLSAFVAYGRFGTV